MSRRILLADDSATIRKIVELTFGDSDVHVETALNGAEALAKVESLRPHLVLADVVMPEPTGYEICRRIKSSERPVPVLLLVGTFETFDHEQARACGADGCLLKPFEPRTLLDRVASLLAEREAVDAASLEPIPAPDAELTMAAGALPATPVPFAAETARGPLEPSAEGQESALPPGFGPATIDAIAQAVVRHMSEEVVRQIAQEVVPRVAEEVVRQRIRELESEES